MLVRPSFLLNDGFGDPKKAAIGDLVGVFGVGGGEFDAAKLASHARASVDIDILFRRLLNLLIFVFPFLCFHVSIS